MKKLYKVGIYCRLSVEDAANSAKAKNYIPGDESVSIENQYEILSKFVMLNGWVEAKTYRDDGYSGGQLPKTRFPGNAGRCQKRPDQPDPCKRPLPPGA